MGVSDEQLSAVAAGVFDTFAPNWSAALAFADAMTRAGGAVSDELYDALSAHFSTEQVVEIAAVAALFNYFNRFANSLNIPVTR